jgi:hypothetical protein
MARDEAPVGFSVGSVTALSESSSVGPRPTTVRPIPSRPTRSLLFRAEYEDEARLVGRRTPRGWVAVTRRAHRQFGMKKKTPRKFHRDPKSTCCYVRVILVISAIWFESESGERIRYETRTLSVLQPHGQVNFLDLFLGAVRSGIMADMDSSKANRFEVCRLGSEGQ